MGTENYKNKRKQAKKMCTAKNKKDPMALKVLGSKMEANKRNETRKLYTIADRMKVRTVHTTYPAALKTTTHPKTRCRKP